jgi:hypothetical protein
MQHKQRYKKALGVVRIRILQEKEHQRENGFGSGQELVEKS